MAFSDRFIAPVRAAGMAIVTIAATAALAVTAHAQFNTHQATYGDSDNDMSQGGIIRTSDGNLIMVGQGGSASQAQGVLVVKLNTCGDTIWSRIYDFGINEIGRKIRKLPDHGFVIVGSFQLGTTYSRDAFLMKIDRDGNYVWLNRYGSYASGIHDEGRDVCVDADGFIYAAGMTRSSGAGRNDGWIWKVDGSGALQWSMTYGGTGDDMFYGLDIAGDSLIAVGQTFSFNAPGYGWTVSVDPGSGGHRWSHWEDDVDELRSVRINPSTSRFVSVGRRALSAFAEDVNLGTGIRNGAMRIESPTAGEALELNEVQYMDGGCYAVGTWWPDAAPAQIYYAQIGPLSGYVGMSRYFGGTMEEQGFSLCEAYDKDEDGVREVAISGYTNSFGSGGYDAYVIGAQRWGESGCYNGEVPYRVKVDEMVGVATNPAVAAYTTGDPLTPLVKAKIPVTVVCRSCVRRTLDAPGGGGTIGQVAPRP